MNDDMKLVVMTAGDCRTGWSLSLGFGSHICDLTTLTLRMYENLPPAEVAMALRDLADSVENLKDEGEDESWLRAREAAWKRSLEAAATAMDIYPPLRQGGRKTRGRNVAPPPQREKSNGEQENR